MGEPPGLKGNIMAVNKATIPSLGVLFTIPIAVSLAYMSVDYVWKAQGIVPKGLLAADPWATSLRCAGATSLPVILFVILTGMLRGITKAENPISDEEKPILKASKSALTNTLEQSFLFTLNILIASSHGLGQETMWLLTAHFIVARIVFYIGYLLGVATSFPVLRSFGFAATLLSNVALLAFNLTHVDQKYQISKVASLIFA